MAEKKKGQRPSALSKHYSDSKSRINARRKRITTRYTDEEYDQILQSAKTVKNSLAEYSRACTLRRKIRDKSPEERQLRLALIQGSNNLNQIAKQMNSYGANAKLIAQVVQQIREFQSIKKLLNS